MIKISIVGSGNVAEAMAAAVAKSEGLELVEIGGRNTEQLAGLASKYGVEWSVTAMLSFADIYILAVSDGAIESVAAEIPRHEGSIIVHTAGSVEMDGLDGVIYPMQSFTKGREVDFRAVPLFIEGADPRIEATARALSDRVVSMSSERRRDLHLAAVFACNFTNAMLTATAEILERADLPLELYRSLVDETISKAFELTPKVAQTGAARRGDMAIQQCHEAMLCSEKREIYKIISKYIWETSRKI